MQHTIEYILQSGYSAYLLIMEATYLAIEMSNGDSGIGGDEWIDMSRKGLLCAIFGCMNKPISQCQFCFKYYCDEDIKNHYHDLIE